MFGVQKLAGKYRLHGEKKKKLKKISYSADCASHEFCRRHHREFGRKDEGKAAAGTR